MVMIMIMIMNMNMIMIMIMIMVMVMHMVMIKIMIMNMIMNMNMVMFMTMVMIMEQINGFPTYRLKNAKTNSIHARFKGCMKNIRATPFKEGSDEFRALELYVASRGNGLSVESPSVRN